MTAGSILAPRIIPLRLPCQGRAKLQIDTTTPVEIKSDSPNVQIFYTLDGSQPAAPHRAAASMKYSRPLLLPPGQVCVRAIAVSSDGRQSSTVTKFFSVDFVDLNESKSTKEREETCEQNSAENSAGSSLQPSEPRMMGNTSHHSLAGSHFLNIRLGHQKVPQIPETPRGPANQHCQAESVGIQDGLLENLSSTQRSRIHRQTHFLRCADCLSLRPSEPHAGFCPQCGSVLPAVPYRLPPAEGGQMLQCVQCAAQVPVNCAVCLLCEAAVAPLLQPQAPGALQREQDYAVCVSCGSGNPADVSHCVLCESRLLDAAVCVRSADLRPLFCSNCNRINRHDAKYCDWCGCKPDRALRSAMCVQCGASVPPCALFCSACGNVLQAVGGAAPPRMASAPPSHDAAQRAVPSSDSAPGGPSAPPTAERQTQTVGLFYSSGTELQRRQSERASKEQQRERERERAHRPLSAVSPGRGYWRQQLDHVCSHLRSFTQNNAAFRVLLGEPRLGRVLSAVLQEDQQEVSLTVNFLSDRQERAERAQVGVAAGGSALSSVTERRGDGRPGEETLREFDLLCRTGSDRSSFRKSSEPNRTAKAAPGPPLRDVQLLQELGPGGRGQVCTVQQLLDQGAGPSCQDSDGRPVLVVATVNGHHDVLPVLVQCGADVNQHFGVMKNTALHEAAALSSRGLKSAALLLSLGASLRRRNGGGQTAFDVAVSSGCSDMVSLLAAHSGQELLGKLVRDRSNMDAF